MSRVLDDSAVRLLTVTAGNLRQSHLYVRELYDFLPRDCIGPARRSQRSFEARPIEIELEGLDETIATDVGTNAKTGEPRGFFRGRTWVRRFFEHHRIAPGEQVALTRLNERRFRLSVQREGDRNGDRPKAAEFFAGIGLVRLALERRGWEVVFANDLDPDKAEMYRHNWPDDDHLVVDDIHALDVATIPKCDLFTASFPCNDLSIAGRWEGLNGKESSAFWGLIRILGELGSDKPHAVLLENVVGFLMSHGGKDFEQALRALNQLGYSVDAVILNASHWTPQSRARLFVIATLDDGGERRAYALASDARPAPLIEFIAARPDIDWNIRDLPPLPPKRATLEVVLEDLSDDDPHWWNSERADYFLSQLSERHAEQASAMIASKRVAYATAFRRVRHGRSMAELRTDGIAGCLRTPRGGSGRQILFKAGKGRYQVRLLTARECARLQGVPDDYVIDVPLNKALFGFGDAVCVPAVEWILQSAVKRHSGAVVANRQD